jgi:type III secretion protein R
MTRRRAYVVTAYKFVAMSLFLAGTAMAQPESVTDTSVGVNKPIVMMIALAAMSLLPFVGLMVTSFVKISVVLSMVRRALGLQQIPPNQVITGLAMILTVYIMMPVGMDIKREIQHVIERDVEGGLVSNATVDVLLEAVSAGQEPMRRFLIKHSHKKERELFYKLARKMRTNAEDRDSVTPGDFTILAPAFVISELKEAFEIGFILYVPFTVIDMVTSNILQALGMSQLSPVTISLPFKILLFVLIDGWFLIARGLVLGYL